MGTVKYSEKKLTELILYVADKCALDAHYGVLKLNKILFYADFIAFASMGSPITGAVYRKYEHGPAPESMRPLKQRLEHSGTVTEWHKYLPSAYGGDGATEKRLFARRSPEMDVFRSEEISVVDSVIEWLRPKTGTECSRMSHRHPGWALAQPEDEIPYESALLDPEGPRPLYGKDLEWAKRVAAEYESGNAKYEPAL